MDDPVRRLIDHAADIYLSLKGIAAVLDDWNTAPRSGLITIPGVDMTQPAPIEIPANDVPALVEWFDRLGTEIDHSKTDTIWSAEDADGNSSTAVSVDPHLDADTSEETATVVFTASTGQFRLVATTMGADGPVRAESALYTIMPGAPAVGQITLNPA